MAYVPVPVRDSNSAVPLSSDINQLQENIQDTRDNLGGPSINVVDDADYTITDVDGYTDIVVRRMSANRVVTLPALSSTSNDRIIRIWHGDAVGSDYKLTVTCAGSDSFENGADNSSVTIPLMSPGDNITLKAFYDNGFREKWDIENAQSVWRNDTFISYGTGWGPHNGGSFIKREGFTVFFNISANKGSNATPWASGDFPVTVNSEFSISSGVNITRPFSDNRAFVGTILGFPVTGQFQIQSSNPNSTPGPTAGWTVQSGFYWDVK